MTKEKPPDEVVDEGDATPFADWLKQHRNGALEIELDQALTEVVEAVNRLGKDGTITITLKFAQQGYTVFVTDDVKAKPPLPNRETAIYYADADSRLVRDDPRQQKLPLNDIPWGDGDLRVVDPDTGELREVGGNP